MKQSRTFVVVATLAAVAAGGGLAAYRTGADDPAERAAEAKAESAVQTVPANAGAPGGPLQAQAEAIVGAGAREWTIMAWSIDRRQTLFAINADSALVPASNNKVYSSIWALEVLGPEYRFPTDLLVSGAIENGVLRGNLVLRGSGDPALGYPEYEGGEPLNSMRAMARSLKAKGVRVVEGGIIGDASIHGDENYGPAWPRDTGNGVSHYAPTSSGLAFQRNMLWVEFRPDRSGVQSRPDVPEIPVVWQSRGGRAYATRKPERDTVIVRGFNGQKGSRYMVGVAEPALLAPAALRQVLREEGVEVRGVVAEGKTPAGAKLIHRHYSITLAEMVPQLNRKSDNFFAEHFWKAAAAKETGKGSYNGGGQASARFFHDRAGVDWGQLWQADGSGLSSQNRTSAHALVSAMYYAHQRPYSKVFHESMAVAGDPDGTMERMFVGMPAQGNLHAKTGYIRGVRSLSGFVRTSSGELVAFSFIYNGRNTSGSRGIQQQLGNLLASYSR